MNIFSDEQKKAIALAIHTGTDFFIVDGVAYEGTEAGEREAYSEWLDHNAYTDSPALWLEWLESEGIPLPEYDGEDYHNDFLVLTDSEADEKTEEEISELLWAFNASFLSDVTGFDVSIFKAIQANGRCDDNNDAIRQLIGDKFDQLVADAIGADGRGHFLSGYDGEENEVNIRDYTGVNEYFYVYQVN